jgi:anthranilate synthase component 2
MLLLIDSYDSFVYNLAHYLGELGAEVDVRRNDALTAEEAIALKPSHIVLSPGPGRPEQAGIMVDLIKLSADSRIPLLGVCLGHQGIGLAFGGKVIRGPVPVHGKTSEIRHQNMGMFNGLPSPFNATRYHSLIIERAGMPNDLIVTADTADGTIMGVRHTTLPVHGVQFHPESIATEHGHAMLKNFLAVR